VNVADRDLAATRAVARSLLGAEIDRLCSLDGGRNSRIYRVEHAGRLYALKQYPTANEDPRDRLGAEVAALDLMERHGVGGVPRVIGVDRDRGFALLSWLDGEPLTAVHEADIDAAVALLAALHGLRGTGEIGSDRLASEACLSGAEIVRQIEARMARLRTVAAAEADLRAFLDHAFAPAFQEKVISIEQLSKAAGIDFGAPLAPGQRSLVPSDFGFHNSLRASDGTLLFCDFEYFGWDDPVKMAADFMLHPGTPVAAHLRRRFRAAAEELYGDDPWFRDRLAAYYPLFGLRWVLILLNDFVPNSWRRELAGTAENWHALKRGQLSKARAFLGRVANETDGRAHGE
jgi:Phosphotransferase enzyme family